MGSSEEKLSKDTIFDILSNPRRRYALYYLRQESGPIKLTKLAEHVAAWENETDVDSLENQERKRVYVSLYQTHIPKLADAGLVHYDEDAGTVELASRATAIDDHLSEPENSIPWQMIYLSATVVGGFLLVVSAFDVGAFGALPEMFVTLAVLVLFAGIAVTHLVYRRRSRSAPSELRPR